MKRLSVIILAGIVMLISACTFSDNDFYYTEPVPGEPPEIWVTTNLDSMDTPTVSDSLEVFYAVDLINSKFYQIEAYIENQFVYHSDTINGSFWLKPIVHSDPGIDTLFFYFFYSTNSNSLADKMGQEYDMLSLDYPINFEEGGLN